MPSHAGICYSRSHHGVIIPLIMTTIMDCRLKGQSFKMMCLIEDMIVMAVLALFFLCGIRKNTDLFLMDGLERLFVKKGMHFISASWSRNDRKFRKERLCYQKLMKS